VDCGLLIPVEEAVVHEPLLGEQRLEELAEPVVLRELVEAEPADRVGDIIARRSWRQVWAGPPLDLPPRPNPTEAVKDGIPFPADGPGRGRVPGGRRRDNNDRLSFLHVARHRVRPAVCPSIVFLPFSSMFLCAMRPVLQFPRPHPSARRADLIVPSQVLVLITILVPVPAPAPVHRLALTCASSGRRLWPRVMFPPRGPWSPSPFGCMPRRSPSARWPPVPTL